MKEEPLNPINENQENNENTYGPDEQVIIGQKEMVDLMLAGILARGHVLLEGVPGIAKTLISNLVARCLSVEFKRIQFTPDLMPSDIIGTSVYDMKSTKFQFRKGPVFSNIVLIDEINRAPAKTQAALFEVMEERQISFEGVTYDMDFPFFVIATQNPIEQEGTYRLPEAQLDRFVFRIKMDYPSLEEEKEILYLFKKQQKEDLSKKIEPVLNAEDLKKLMSTVEEVYIKDSLCDYIAEIVHKTRNSGSLFLGASPRASIAIMNTSRAFALIQGRGFVIPEDIRQMTLPVLNHRIVLSPEKELEGFDTEDVIRDIIEQIEVPR